MTTGHVPAADPSTNRFAKKYLPTDVIYTADLPAIGTVGVLDLNNVADDVLHGDGTWGPAESSGPSGESLAAMSGTSGVVTGDCSVAQVFTVAPTGNITLAFTGVPTGVAFEVKVVVVQSSSVRSVTLPNGSAWLDAAPTQVANRRCEIRLLTTDGGSSWLAWGKVAASGFMYNFVYTGAVQWWKAPATGTVALDFAGASGAAAPSGALGGKGARVQGSLAVTANQWYAIWVGGAGAVTGTTAPASFNGGGAGGVSGSTPTSGPGGGGTDLRAVADGSTNGALSDRVAVAAGGGGGGTSTGVGGDGGGTSGSSGTGVNAGSGGTQSTGGGRGSTGATNGALGVGGDGSSGAIAGGGGGGGYYGGGGAGANAGGGGGSSLTTGLTGVTVTAGYQTGNGYLNITY